MSYDEDMTMSAEVQIDLQMAEEQLDIDAIAWAYGKCVAFGLENGSMKSAMMMDRLKMMLGGYVAIDEEILKGGAAAESETKK